MSYYSATGDIFCTPGDKLQGDRMIEQMKAYWFETQNRLPAPYGYDFMGRFQPAVRTLLKSREDVSTFWGASDCTIRDIGLQAQALMLEMTVWVASKNLSVTGVPTTQEQTKNPLDKFFNELRNWSNTAKIAVLGVVGIYAYSVFRKK